MEPVQNITELNIGGPVDLRVALDPYLSALALGVDAFSRHRGAPVEWRRRILSSLQPRSALTMSPLTAAGRSVVPSSVKPLNPIAETPISDQVERLRALPADRLLDDLETVFTPGALPAHWRHVADRPDDWLHRYADTMAEVWGAVEPLWKRAPPLLDREIERIGIASVRGELGTVLGDLHPTTTFNDGILKIADPEPARFALGERPLVLVPMLSGSEALICAFDDPEAVWIAYPLPTAGRLARGHEEPAEEAGSLDFMIGPVRTALLRAVARPLSMGELAGLTRLAPSAMTYHCERLVKSGLIRRERYGREIRISQTGRGRRLVEIFPPDTGKA